MLTASAHGDDGHTLLVLGLSAENIVRLKQGKPIRVSRETHGLAVPPALTIVIFTGETEDSMEAMLRAQGFIGPETVLNQDKPQ